MNKENKDSGLKQSSIIPSVNRKGAFTVFYCSKALTNFFRIALIGSKSNQILTEMLFIHAA